LIFQGLSRLLRKAAEKRSGRQQNCLKAVIKKLLLTVCRRNLYICFHRAGDSKIFEYDAPDLIVKSGAAGAAAHDGFTWEIEGDQFVSCDTCSNDSSFFNEVIDSWIESASTEQREAFIRDFFNALEAGGATRMSEITANGMDGLEAVMISLIRLENRTKIVILKFLQSALNGIIKSDWKNLLRTKEMAAGAMLFILGILIIRAPTLAGKCISVSRIYGMASQCRFFCVFHMITPKRLFAGADGNGAGFFME